MKSAFNKRLITLSYENGNRWLLPEIFFNAIYGCLRTEVKSFLDANYALKFNIDLHVIFLKSNMEDLENTPLEVKIIKTEMKDYFSIRNFESEFPAQVVNIKRKIKEFQTREGGWTLVRIKKVDFYLNKYQPLKGSSFIELPRSVRLKQACVNIQNRDIFCFKWCVIAAVSDIKKQPQRISKYNVDIYSKIIITNGCNLNFQGLKFPLKAADVSIFEEKNPCISVNVFGYDNKEDLVIGPFYKTKKKKSTHINLLYIEKEIRDKTVGHYVWIKNLSRLIRSQITAHGGKVYICDTCLYHFKYELEFKKHIENSCQKKEDFTNDGTCILEYQNLVKTVPVPFVIYANSYNLLQNTETDIPKPYVFTYFIKCSYNKELNTSRCFKGPEATKLFVESLIKDSKHLYNNHSTIIASKIPLTEEEQTEFEKNNSCYICSKLISEDKVKLHCRLTGKYNGPAHHSCAFSYRIPKKFPVIFNNLSIHDYQSLIKELSDIDDDLVEIIPLSKDAHTAILKWITLDKGGKLQLRFLNSFRFLPFSLDNLVQNLSSNEMVTLKSFYPEHESKFNLLLIKGVFPYTYLNSIEKLSQICLPSIHCFFNAIIDQKCSIEDYNHAKEVWSVFNCKTLEDYLMLYLKRDVLLLTDVFEHFRLICQKTHNLDPCHNYTAAEFSWDAVLKLTDIKLSLLKDNDMISFLQNGLRGNIVHCSQKYSMANNKYLRDYNDNMPSKYLMNLHTNDLYSRVMSDYLPESNFEWLTDLKSFSLDSLTDDSKIGYILEVDLQYPIELHDFHKNLPFCCEKRISFETKERSLVFDFNYKYNYVIYYKNLQQCLKHGLKLQKIHRILKFNQSDWLKKYILFNNSHKSNAKTSFERNIFKLFNDSVYERIMETPSTKFKLLSKWESEGRKLGVRAFINKPEFSSAYIFDENLVSVELNINPYKNMPIYLEFVIGELTKWKLYGFHYDYMLRKYNTNAELNYIEGDTFIYTITTDDFYKDITEDICVMFNKFASDTSDNKSEDLLKTLGMMKDANHGIVMKEFIALGSKMYSLRPEDVNEINIADRIINTNCKFSSLSDYKYCLYNKFYFESINFFKTILHKMYISIYDKYK